LHPAAFVALHLLCVLVAFAVLFLSDPALWAVWPPVVVAVAPVVFVAVTRPSGQWKVYFLSSLFLGVPTVLVSGYFGLVIFFFSGKIGGVSGSIYWK
jgi:hypothetical protein